ncbi:uncharacterized protein LOC112601549 [Melanaphis sacchari]|uniref:uncharacterized protein LOC112601549 n=1 Tax=Melanaphis sacchari TaxID=742174 RepID=UPI000DC131EF|nr:uncharacterized protein LOC112601549 [Melanaphis sacchari]
MSSSKDTAHCKDSTSNLLKLLNGERLDHRVVTRQDLTTDYPLNDDDNDNSTQPSNSESVVAINNYYTWNSSRTNSPIHKEREQIISALQSVKSISELCRELTTRNIPHRMKEIMSMCADRRGDFSSDEYHHHHHHINSGNEPDASQTNPNVMTTDRTTLNRRSWSSSYFGGASRCWSCTATDRETDDVDNDKGNDKNANVDETNCRRKSKRQLSWRQKLKRKFRNSRNSR